MTAEIPYQWHVHVTTQIWVVFLIVLKQISLGVQPIRVTTQIIMDFLQSFFKLRIGNQWCHCKMSAVFSGFTFLSLFYMPWMQAHRLLSFKYMDRSVIILALFLWCCLLLLIFCKGGFFLSFWMHKECCHWNKSSWWTISSCRVVYYTLKHGSTFWVSQWNPLSSNFLWWRWW